MAASLITSEKAKLYALFTIVVFITALGSLSQTAVNSTMGAISSSFGITESTGQWLTTAYMLVVGIVVPAVTFLSRRMTTFALITLSLVLFLAGCVIDFAAPVFWMALIGRILQAASAGITMPLLQAIANVRFPVDQRATAMGIAGIALGFAPNFGPIIGGVIADAWGWRYLFVLLAAFCVLLIGATALCIDRNEQGSNADAEARLDAASLIYSTIGFGGLLLAISNASSVAFTSPFLWAPALVGAAFVILFFRRQSKTDHPLIDLAIFRYGKFNVATLAQCTLMLSYLGITLLISMYWQNLCGGSASESGLLYVPATILALILNPLAGWAADRFGIRPVSILGASLMTAGAIMAAFMNESTPLWAAIVIQTVRGSGMSMIIGPTMTFALNALPSEITMDGSSWVVLIRQACASLGTACMVLIVSVLGSTTAVAYQAAFAFSAIWAVIMLSIIVFCIKE